jgi:OmcA/MtrC family decaheme c-type cytochrome
MKANSLLKKFSFWIVIAVSLTAAQQKHNFSPREKAFYADAQTVEFVNPGLVITVTGATIAANGTITVQYTLTDPTKLPLDSAGIYTPGPISTSFVAAYIPNGQEQYIAYTTKAASGTLIASETQPGADSGGVTTALGNGAYQYVFGTKAPTGFDTTATNTIGVYGSRNLTSYGLATYYASTTFNFVPNGAKVTHTRDVIETSSCNQCHEQLSAHGGSRRGVNLCVMCHTPQNVDPNTGATVDFKSFIHRIHMGSSLPSVVAGGTFEITTSFGTSNYSTVVDPASAQRCEVCHQQTTGAAQATAFMTNPTRVACGSCHDNVNFATGANHPGGFQTDDTMCADCHIPQGETPFDASIMGAHVVATDTPAFYPQNPDTLIAGINVVITGVTNTKAGSAPVVAFTLLDNNKNPIALSALGSLSFTMAGPTTDYGYTLFGAANASTPGYVTETANVLSKCGATGSCTYAFTNIIPAKAAGTYAIGAEARITQTVLAGTTSSQSVEYGAFNPVTYFSVDGSPVAARRTIVQMANCNTCHVALSEHGTLRSNVEYCVMCHNPSNTDAVTRATAIAPYVTQPPQGINFNLLVHRIHDGVNVTADGGQPYIVVGFGASINNFSGVLFPGLAPTGAATDLENCAFCHVNSSEQADLSLAGLNPVTDPQGLINPVQPFASACSGCHVDIPSASHFLANTTILGESCAVCHGTNGAYSVDSVHAQY